jgi:hypothetical protein
MFRLDHVGNWVLDRWRLIDGFLAPSRANSDECRQRPVPMTTGVRRDRCPKGKCLKARVHTGVNPAAASQSVRSQLAKLGKAKALGDFWDRRSFRWPLSFGRP